jgi:hypothetical protein
VSSKTYSIFYVLVKKSGDPVVGAFVPQVGRHRGYGLAQRCAADTLKISVKTLQKFNHDDSADLWAVIVIGACVPKVVRTSNSSWIPS